MRELLTSKKFVMAVVATIVAAAGKLGLELPTDTVALLMTPLLTYVAAQGLADYGKNAAKVDAVAKVITEDARLTTEDTIHVIKNT